ncbi:hypothetical protein BDV23DRAFT_166313 [Aspergillus alliaceus]|uniref:Uncharacterized protein n=1 Tax=Petromyces alliaceus TaxID=209559 RepID=A0A5N7BSA1_PETAA|nr:hypothetical protein BDV23DRAFT_166313 [Aspergillus alliaceus]
MISFLHPLCCIRSIPTYPCPSLPIPYTFLDPKGTSLAVVGDWGKDQYIPASLRLGGHANVGMKMASDLRAFGARDTHSSLPDQPGRLNLELQAMDVLLPSGLIGFPHLVDRSLSPSIPTAGGPMIGSPSETRADGPNHGLRPLPSRPLKRTTARASGLFLVIV